MYLRVHVEMKNVWCLKCRVERNFTTYSTLLCYLLQLNSVLGLSKKFRLILQCGLNPPPVLQTQSDLLAYFVLAGLKTAAFYVLFSALLLLFTFSNDPIHTTLANEWSVNKLCPYLLSRELAWIFFCSFVEFVWHLSRFLCASLRKI